jgi:SLT domain-containing protein
LAQIQRESMGQPDIVNNSDSNAAKGTPAKGLLQMIGPTYQANAKSGYTDLKYQTVPYANLWAALNYVKRSYGMSKFDSWSAGSNGSY